MQAGLESPDDRADQKGALRSKIKLATFGRTQKEDGAEVRTSVDATVQGQAPLLRKKRKKKSHRTMDPPEGGSRFGTEKENAAPRKGD